MHDHLEQITGALDYEIKCKHEVAKEIDKCLHILQDNYNQVGGYSEQLINAANTYDNREEELLKMFDQLEIETLDKNVTTMQDKDQDRSSVMKMRDRNWTKSPREPLDIQEEMTNERSLRDDIKKNPFTNMVASHKHMSDGGGSGINSENPINDDEYDIANYSYEEIKKI